MQPKRFEWSGRRVAVGVMLTLLVLGAARLSAVAGLLPYSQHVDETFFTTSIVKMVREGDANPRFFRYPSLPLYLSTAAVLSASPIWPDERDAMRPATAGDAYAAPALFSAPRFLLALLSIAALGLLALVAHRVFGALEALLVPLLFSFSGIYQMSAVEYMNVDVVTVFFVAATLAVVFARWQDEGILAKSVWPGVLSGMVVASKYNSGLILVPCALAIYYQGGDQKLRKLVALGVSAAAAFFVCVPYSLLDAGFFLEQVLYEIEHYRTGQGFANSEPGPLQFAFYLAALVADYGGPLMGLSLLGIFAGFRRRRAQTITLLSLPLLMLIHMSTNSLNFLRTILPVYAVCSVLQAAGIRQAVDWIADALVGWHSAATPSATVWLRGAGAAALLLAVPFTVEWGRLLDLGVEPDPRNRVAAFLLDERREGEAVLVAQDVGLDEASVRRAGAALVAPDLADLDAKLARAPGGALVVLPRYAPPDRYRSERAGPVRALQEARASDALARARALEANGGVRVLEIEGRGARVAPRPGLASPGRVRPAIRVVRVPTAP